MQLLVRRAARAWLLVVPWGGGRFRGATARAKAGCEMVDEQGGQLLEQPAPPPAGALKQQRHGCGSAVMAAFASRGGVEWRPAEQRTAAAMGSSCSRAVWLAALAAAGAAAWQQAAWRCVSGASLQVRPGMLCCMHGPGTRWPGIGLQPGSRGSQWAAAKLSRLWQLGASGRWQLASGRAAATAEHTMLGPAALFMCLLRCCDRRRARGQTSKGHFAAVPLPLHPQPTPDELTSCSAPWAHPLLCTTHPFPCAGGGPEGQGVRADPPQLLRLWQLWLWHQRAHRPGHQVRPLHRHLRCAQLGPVLDRTNRYLLWLCLVGCGPATWAASPSPPPPSTVRLECSSDKIAGALAG